MGKDTTSSQRGRLNLGSAETVDMTPIEPRPRRIQLEKDPALGLLSLEDRFQDHGEIARGGMGSIHQVLERTLNRTVAMKVLPTDRQGEQRLRNRFLTEAQVTGQLEHPNIVPVYELGADDDGKLFFTMRLIEGHTLTEHFKHVPPDSDEGIEQSLEIYFRVCDALSFAHSRGVVHRDVKPSNIMVGDFGQVYLMDWGIARALSPKDASASGTQRRKTTTLTIPAIDESGMVVGTYSYMAPEQAQAKIEAIDQRTDVFSLGAVLFRIAAGRPPIHGQTAVQALANASEARLVEVTEDMLPSALHRALYEVALQAMQRDPGRRFQSVASLKRATQSVLRGRFRFPVRRVTAGTRILVEGEAGDDAYYIRSGQCRVYAESDGVQVELKTLEAGEVFGETAVFTGQPRNASVEAVCDVDLLVVPGSFLSGTLGLDAWTGAFVRSLGERFTEGNRRVTALEIGQDRADAVCQVLRCLALKGERLNDGSMRIGLAALRSELGLCRELDQQHLPGLLGDAGLGLKTEDDITWVILNP